MHIDVNTIQEKKEKHAGRGRYVVEGVPCSSVDDGGPDFLNKKVARNGVHLERKDGGRDKVSFIL